MTLVRDKKTIYDGDLPRVAMNLSQLKQLHARMLRLFAEYPGFESDRLRVVVRTFTKKCQQDYPSLQEFLDHNSAEILPTSLELSYSYSSVGYSDVVLMDAKLTFGETGRNSCFLSSNVEGWVDSTHQVVHSKLSQCKLFRSGHVIKSIGFYLAIICLMLFGSSVIPFTSMAMGIMSIAFMISMIVVALPHDSAPFRKLSENRIFLS
ncbi:hypothetical protein D3C87_636960 [compost metagenome]